jgi:hypothetical protein
MTHNELYKIVKDDQFLKNQKSVSGVGIGKSSIGDFYIKIFLIKEIGAELKHKIANMFLKYAPVEFEIIGMPKSDNII